MKILILILTMLALGCGEETIEEGTAPALTSIGPLEVRGHAVDIYWTVRDDDGDDVDIAVFICRDQNCGAAIQARGGDGTSRLPTVPAGQDILHLFAWNYDCDAGVAGGYFDGTNRVGAQTDLVYRVRIVLETTGEELESMNFTLEDLGITELLGCGPREG